MAKTTIMKLIDMPYSKDYGEDTLTFGQEYDDDYFEGRDYEYESDT